MGTIQRSLSCNGDGTMQIQIRKCFAEDILLIGNVADMKTEPDRSESGRCLFQRLGHKLFCFGIKIVAAGNGAAEKSFIFKYAEYTHCYFLLFLFSVRSGKLFGITVNAT